MVAAITRRICRTVIVAGTVVATMSCAPAAGGPHADYCAIMADGIGLYVDNPVTQMGYPIGKVNAVTPSATDVRVDFTVNENRRLPADVKAVIRSTSILADRALELVGNYQEGPQLAAGGCIPLSRSATPESLSQVIGSLTTFVDSINPEGSKNLGGTVSGLDRLVRNNGAGVNTLLTSSSALLDSPDQAISHIGSIVNNLADLTNLITEIRGPLKEVLLDMKATMPDVVVAADGGNRMVPPIPPLIDAVADIETTLGEQTQLTLDTVAMSLRKMSPHATAMADLLNPIPGWINTAADHFNNRQFSIRYRPPMFRIRTPVEGLVACGFINARTPGSCVDVGGQPYAVDVALLQYVLTQANR